MNEPRTICVKCKYEHHGALVTVASLTCHHPALRRTESICPVTGVRNYEGHESPFPRCVTVTNGNCPHFEEKDENDE